MRIAFFHNWSWLGSALARALLEDGQDDLWLLGGHVPRAERDPDLLARARRRGVLSVAPRDVGSPMFVRRLERFAPDLIVVGTFPRKLPPVVLGVPKVAAINVHSSLLPAYRGALPEFWVIRNGEAATGVSIHHMTERFDAGHVLAQTAIPLNPEDNLLTISIRIARAAEPLLMELLARYRSGERPAGSPQDEGRASTAPFVREHHLEVDWTECAQAIERLTRASFPVFEAFTYWRGERVVVRAVRVIPPSEAVPWVLGPGEVRFDRPGDRLLAGTGQGMLSLVRIEAREDAAHGARFAERHGIGVERVERLGR